MTRGLSRGDNNEYTTYVCWYKTHFSSNTMTREYQPGSTRYPLFILYSEIKHFLQLKISVHMRIYFRLLQCCDPCV